ncbi:MAG TPA: dihydrolipoamide acetyltransferase family protein, partial [Tissierellaceae bacterium]|nr:dihydrolipoamide acetyltransferase family protein [Tissierellaceae bacterium]
VMKEDIRRAANKKDKAKSDDRPSLQDIEVQVEENVEKVSLTRIRQTIAEQMSNSKFTIPHATAMDEFSIKALVDFRNKYKDKLKNQNTKLTYLPFIIKAALVAMKEFPEFNAQLDLDKDKLILKKYYHIGIATDTERGLMVPVVKNAHHMSLVELAKNIEDVSSRAKKNQIQIEELRGSTFTVTNYGSIGGQFGVPIINYPETAILGVGRAVEKPIVIDGEIGIAPMLTLSLSYDHRVIDGAMAARFLNLIKDLLSEPELLLLKS